MISLRIRFVFGFLVLISTLSVAQTSRRYNGTVTRPIGNNIGPLPKWSSPSTWNNNRVPLPTDNVLIPSGSTVVMDQDVTVKNIMVHGTLVIDPTKNIRISTHSIEVMGAGAYWEWGTEANPYAFKGVLTFSQDSPTERTPMSNIEAKVIMVMDGAVMELHGKEKRSWTVLNATASVASSVIRLRDAVDWSVGDSILVSSTDWSMEQNETFCIQSISTDRRSITLTTPLQYTHWGTTETFSNNRRSWTLDERAEVALLTRNIVIQGDAASESNKKGVYFMVMESGVAKVSGVELYRTGLGGVMARYPFHWHLAKDVRGQYIKNCSIHRAYNRAITVHGTQNALVDNNVCYDVIGHAIFLEDGIEYGNTISSNFVASVKQPTRQDKLLDSDILVGVDNRATGPAGLWITHPDNVVINNHVSGAGSGIWYALPENPTGESFADGRGIQNRRIPIRRFENNSAHSCAVGVTFDYSAKQDSEGNVIGVETAHYDPRVYTLIQKIQSFKNIRGLWFRGSNQVGFSDFVLADNQGNGSFIPTFKSRFSNGCTIGYSANNTNINFPTFGTSFYDGAQEIYDCHFENFDQRNQSIFNIFGGANKSIYNQVRGLTYKKCNIYNPYGTLEASPHNSFAIDLDGSLTGQVNGMMCLNHPFYVDTIPGNFTPFNETYGWGRKTDLKFGQIKIDRTSVIKNAMFYYEWADGHSMHDTGVPGSPFGQMTVAVNTSRLYKLRFVDFIPASTNLTLYSSYRAGDRVTFVIQGSPVELVITGNGMQKVTNMPAFNAATGNVSYWVNNELYVKMVATGANYLAGGTFALRTMNDQIATPIKLKSRPYRRGGHPINSTIQAEHFDFGGQNVAYFSDRLTSSGILPNAKYEHSREVRLGEIVTLNNAFNTAQRTVETVIERTKPNEYWNYTCTIPSDGFYDVVMNLGAANASNRIQLLINDVVVKDTTFARLGATNDLKSFVFPRLSLRRGLQVVTFKVFSPNLVFNSFTITPPNTPPVVTISSPQLTRTNYALSTVTLNATATDANGIARVEFYQGTRLIGTDATFPYSITVGGLGVGTHTFRARAFDGLLLSATSAGISIPVVPLVCLATITQTSPLTFCQGGSVVLNASTGTSYQWVRGSSTVGTSRTFVASTTGLYSVIVSQANGCKDTSTAKSVVVHPLPLATISTAGATTFCQGNSVALTASQASTYEWTRNGNVVGTARSFVSSLSGIYTVKLTNTNGCFATSSPVTVSVMGLVPVSVSVVSSATTVCSGSGVSFTATGINTGGSPRYQWFVNNTPRATGTGFNFTPAHGDLVRVTLSLSGTCLTGNPASSGNFQINVNPLVRPSLTVNPSSNPTCANTTVVYSVQSTNAGTLPAYRWRVNGILRTSTTSTFSYIPSNGDIIHASITTGGTLPTCLSTNAATSAGILSIVNATIPSTLSIIPSSTTVCQGSSVRFTASAAGTGTNPRFAWYINSALQSNTTGSFTYVPTNGQTVRATMLPGGTGLTCVTGGMASATGISLQVVALQNAQATISASTSTVCSGGFVGFTASGTNLGTLPNFTWLVNGAVQASGNTLVLNPTSPDVIQVIGAAGGTIPSCVVQNTATTNSITLHVVEPIRPIVSVMSSGLSVCSGSGIGLTVSGVNGGSSPSYHWLLNGMLASTSTSFHLVPSNGDQIKAVMKVGGNLPNCLIVDSDTALPLQLQVDPLVQPTLQITASRSVVCTGTGVSVTANSTLAGTSPQIQWYINRQFADQGNTLQFTPNHGDEVQAVVFPSGQLPSCLAVASVSSNVLRWDVNPCLPPIITSISGPSFVSMNLSTAIYAVPSVPGDTYDWRLPEGVTLLEGQGTSEIRVQFTEILDGILAVTQTNSYGNTTATMEIHSGIPPVLSDIQGDSTILENSTNVRFEVASSPGVSYQWYVPAGVSIVGGNRSNQLILNVGRGVLGALSLTSTNMYGSTTQNITIVSGALPVIPGIVGPSQVAPGQTDVVYSVESQDETTYFWTVNTSDTLVTGQGTYSIVVNFGSEPTGSIQVMATNDFGSTSATLAISEMVVTGTGNATAVPTDIVLFPNPTEGTFSIRLGHGLTDVRISVLDIKGVEVMEEQRSTTGLGGHLPAGHYVVRVKSNAGIKHLPLIKFE